MRIETYVKVNYKRYRGSLFSSTRGDRYMKAVSPQGSIEIGAEQEK